MAIGNSVQQSAVSSQLSAEANAAIIYITGNGFVLAKRLNGLYPHARIEKYSSSIVHELWRENKNLIFIMATGIVVRTIAPLLKDKKTDPAVVVLDEKGRFAISLMSGHLGGANELAEDIARFLGGEAIITTASDINNMTSVDLWARDNNLTIDNWDHVPAVSSRLLRNGRLNVYSDFDVKLPDDFILTKDIDMADIIITSRNIIDKSAKDRLVMRPKNIIAGIGCNSGTSADEIENVVKKALEEKGISISALHSIATIDRKGNEPGLIAFAKKHGVNMRLFIPEKLNSVKGVEKSEAAFRATGANAVAEPAALLASGSDSLLLKKQKNGNVTIALAEIKGMERNG